MTQSTSDPLSEAEYIRAWVSRHLDLISSERDAEVAETSLLMTKSSPSLLAAHGLALLSLSPTNVSVGLGGKTLIELQPDAAYANAAAPATNPFRPGDLAGLSDASKASKQEAPQLQGVVSKVSPEGKVTLAVETADEVEVPQRGNLLKLANDAVFDRMQKTMNDLRRKLLPSPDSSELATPDALTAVLLGLQAPTPPSDEFEVSYLDSNLNESQKEAVKLALRAEELALIHGPPGTGKTHTLVEVIRQLVDRGKSVLVCGASNLAVDNLVERLAMHQVPLTRLGHPARIVQSIHSSTLDYQMAHSNAVEVVKDIKKDIDTLLSDLSKGKIKGKERKSKWEEVRVLRKEYRKREAGAVQQVVGQAKVVLATCHGAGGKQLFNRQFDVAVIDEAAQATEAVCWIPILKSKKLILAGDHLQLPPTVKAASTEKLKLKASHAAPPRLKNLKMPKTLSLTLFDRMIELWGKKGIKTMLNVQYRMCNQIADFPAAEMYGGDLKAAEAVENRKLSDLPTFSSDDEDLQAALVFFDTAGLDMFDQTEEDQIGIRGDSKFNENEASVVCRHVRSLVEAGVPVSSFSIISPYSAQVAHLGRTLRPDFPEIEIGTVDGFQGRENDVVVLSLVRSNDKREVGFLSDERRLNVAMTRPRRQLCVVGDSDTVGKGGKLLKSWVSWLEEHAAVLYPEA